MTNAFDVDTGKLIKSAGAKLKGTIDKPQWAGRTKSGSHSERLPYQADFWYDRCASILWQAYSKGVVGVNRLRGHYGGKKNRGHKPEKFYPASGSIIRKILQQLEKAELIKQAEKGVHKGRILTPKGISFLDKIAVQLAKQR